MWKEKINNLVNELPKIYPELNFENHCYRRIAYDNVLGCKWNTKYSNFIKEATNSELKEVYFLLGIVKHDRNILLDYNKTSLTLREHENLYQKN